MQAKSALDLQVGGGHYKDCWMQPVEFWLLNQLPATEGSVVKYLFRWPKKAGVEDLKKAKHFIEIMIEAYFCASPKVAPIVLSPDFEWRVTPEEFCLNNRIDAITGTALCLACYCRSKQDLEHAIAMINGLIEREEKSAGAVGKPVNSEKLRAQNAIFVAINRLEDLLPFIDCEVPMPREQRANQRMLIERNLKFLRAEARA